MRNKMITKESEKLNVKLKLMLKKALMLIAIIVLPIGLLAQNALFEGEWKNRTEKEYWNFDDQSVVTTSDAKGTYTVDGRSISFTLSWMEDGEKMSAAYSGVLLDATTMEVTYVMDNAEPNSFVLDKVEYFPLTGGWKLPGKEGKWWFDASGNIQARGAFGEYVRSGYAVSIVLTDETTPENEPVAYAGYFMDGNTIKLVRIDKNGESRTIIITRMRSGSVRK